MKRTQKGFIETTLIVMLLTFAGVVGTHVAKGEKAQETPAVHNYNK